MTWAAKARPEDNYRPVRVVRDFQLRGTFPPLMGEGPDGSTYLPHSRQEARHIGRALRFNAITASFYALPRRERRRLSRTQG